MKKVTIYRSKIRVVATPNGVNYTITDTNPTRRCVASVINLGAKGWTVRIDKGGVDGWKYATGLMTQTAEAAYELCLDCGTTVTA